MKFSQRIGKTEIRIILQKDSIDDILKNKLWNEFYNEYYKFYDYNFDSFLKGCLKKIWTDFFNRKVNDVPYYSSEIIALIEKWFFNEGTKWYEVYDFIELVSKFVKICETEYPHMKQSIFVDRCNIILENELSAYRIINYQVTPISDEVEIESIENALKSNDKFKEVSTHLNSSISSLSNRENPDYRNSIKECISAVESVCKIITGENTLGKALNNLEKSGIKINPSLKSAFEKLYTYTNDSKTGIRHAMIDAEYSPDFDEAKFMLVTCSTFINYLKSKSV